MNALSEEGTRYAAPELEAGVTYDNFRLAGFMEAGLPHFSDYPTASDADPFARQALRFGIRLSAAITLSGHY